MFGYQQFESKVGNRNSNLSNKICWILPAMLVRQKKKIHHTKVFLLTQSEIYRRGIVENGYKLLIMVDHAWKCQ